MADPVTIFLGVSAAASALSGAVGYVGAQRQADGIEQQAQQAQLLAANRAQIQRNNALGQAQDEQFQAGVSRLNQREALIETDRAVRDRQDKTRTAMASAQARGARSGMLSYSFDDVLRSEAMLAEREEADILYSGAQQGYQFSRSADLSQLRAGRAIEMGRYSSALTITEGAYTSSALRSQASSTRIGSYGTLVGGLAQGASTASGIWT
jgi:hypothetical protein